MSGRRAARFAAAVVLALSCVCSLAAANVRAAADVGLAELSAGPGFYFGYHRVESAWTVTAQAVRLEFGAELTDHIGLTVGAMLIEASWVYGFSILPVSARAYWDFTPNALWIRRTAYITTTYRHRNVFPDEPDRPPYFNMGIGATFTWYAATVRAELAASALRYPVLEFRLGLEVGGSYIFGRHHESGRKG
jgi:hypothetical protein